MSYNLNGYKDDFYNLIEKLDQILDRPENDDNLHSLRFICSGIIRILDHSITYQENIKQIVDNYFGIDCNLGRKTKPLSEYRQIGMTLACELTKESFRVIGETFGGKKHSTVLYAKNKINGLLEMKGEEKLRKYYNELKQIIQGNG